jgi:ectoine hydroxylase
VARNGRTSALASAVIDTFKREGYYLHRGMFSREAIGEVTSWLDSQDHESLAKSWTEKEPAVQLAVLSGVHRKENAIATIANDERMLDIAAELMGSPVYIWSSKMNLKAPWCGTVEYYHQDLVYWKDRGYPRDEMLSCMVCVDPHGEHNAGLRVMPGTHRLGYIEHEPFININGLGKYMVPPATLSSLYEQHGLVTIEAEPGDVLFFHTSLVHGSPHNSGPHSRRIILSQLNTVGNEPIEVNSNARKFNLRRAHFELEEAERRYDWFRKKYQDQLESEGLTFSAPVPPEEKVKS